MVEKLSATNSSNNSNRMSVKPNRKGGRGSMSNRHLKNTKVQNNFSCGGSNSLNWRNDTSKNSVNESNNYGYTNHYVASAFYMLVGLPVEIQKTDGIIYEGILETVSNKVEFHLSHACQKPSSTSFQDGMNKSEKMYEKIMFPFCDVVYCKAKNVDLDFAKRDTLLTDGAITGTNGALCERELVQWQPEDNTETLNAELGENDMDAGWAFDEMMRVNAEEHGVKSTYDSSLSSYMTPIEKGDAEEYRVLERRAEQVAREIQKDPKFKETELIDSNVAEEDLFSAVPRTPTSNTNSNSINNNSNSSSPNKNNNNTNTTNNTVNNNSNSNNNSNNNNNIITNNNNSSNNNNSNNNDGFTTYTGKNYRTNRHPKQPQSNVVGPRLQRINNSRNHDNQNHASNGNHQVSRNHVSSPQRSQNGGSSRSYQQQQQQQSQQPPPHVHMENHKVPVTSHQLQENIPPINNIRTQADVSSSGSTRTTLSYSAVAKNKNPALANNRTHTAPKQTIPSQPVVPDIIQPIQQAETFAPIPSHNTNAPSPLVPNGHLTPAQKMVQSPPSRTPEALAAAKQQVIQDAKKKASIGHTQTTSQNSPPPLPVSTLTSSQVTLSLTSTSPVVSPPPLQQPQTPINQPKNRQPLLQSSSLPTTPSHSHSVEAVDKNTHRQSPVKVESLEKSPVNTEMKPESPIIPSVSPKEQRSRVEDGKQPPPFLMKYGKIHTQVSAEEEKKGGSYKDLKEFKEQFKLSEPKKRISEKSAKTPELPVKTPEVPLKAKTEEKQPDADTEVPSKPVVSKMEEVSLTGNNVVTTSPHTSPHSAAQHVVTTTAVSTPLTVVSCLSVTTTTTTTSVASSVVSVENSASSKPWQLNPSAKEFNPGKETPPPFVVSPKTPLAKQTSFPGEQVQHTVVQQQQQQQPHYYHGGAVMIHPNGSEVLSPTVQQVPVKQIYPRAYMSSGGTAVYSIPAAVDFPNNANNSGPQLIAPQSGFIPAQNMSGQQVIIIHGPNGSVSYQPVVPSGQSQQYYPMQHQMIRCVTGHPAGNGVQQNVGRVPGNFQQDGSQGGYVIAVSQHGGLVQHQAVAANQHQVYHPPQSPVQSSHMQQQYVMSHQVASSNPQNPQNAAQFTYTQGNSGATYRSPSSIHTTGPHHPQQPFVMVTHQGQHIQTVAMANNQTYVQGQQHGGILPNYQSGN